MGKYDYLLGKGKEFKIGEDVYKINPLSAQHLDMFMGGKDSSQSDMVFEIIKISLQQTDKSITIDDVKSLPIPIFKELSELVMEINELNQK